MRVFDIRKDSLETIRKYENRNEEIEIKGCLGERYIGCAMRNGILHVKGTPGNGLASYLDGGTIYVDGNAQDATADTMNAGLVAVRGSAGDALAYGMRSGRVYVLGDAGYPRELARINSSSGLTHPWKKGSAPDNWLSLVIDALKSLVKEAAL